MYFIKYYPFSVKFKIDNSTSNLQFFFDSGKGFGEYESVRYLKNSNDEKNFTVFRINRKLEKLRVDPRDNSGPFQINILSIKPFFGPEINLIPNKLNHNISQQMLLRKNTNFGVSTGDDPSLVITNLDLKNKIPLGIRICTSFVISIFFGAVIYWIYLSLPKVIVFLKNKNNSILSFLLLFLCLIFISKFHTNLGFPGDSGDYWQHSKDFIYNNKFSFLNYKYPLRGYSFPFILFVIRQCAQFLRIEQILFFKLVNIAFFSFSIGVLVPSFFQLLNCKKIYQYQIIIFAFIFLAFWSGFVAYPLTDFISVFVIFGSLYLLEYVTKYNKNHYFLIFSGLLLGVALNSRPIYQISAVIIILYFIYNIFIKKATIRLFLLYLIGLMIVLSPQIYINYFNFKTVSPFVPTKVAYKTKDLYLTQLIFGLNVQRHECGLFIDRQGEGLLRTKNPPSFTYGKDFNTYIFNKSIISYKQYLSLVYNHPFDFITIYARHLFNGLDTFHNDLYYCDIYASRLIYSFFNYSLWFLFFIYLFCYWKLSKPIYPYIYYLVIAIPSIFSIPTAIETRFFIPVYLLMYATICFSVIPIVKLSIAKKISIKHLIIYLIFIAFCFGISSIIFSQYESLVVPRLMDHMKTKTEHILLY
jgi:hypothetical protein